MFRRKFGRSRVKTYLPILGILLTFYVLTRNKNPIDILTGEKNFNADELAPEKMTLDVKDARQSERKLLHEANENAYRPNYTEALDFVNSEFGEKWSARTKSLYRTTTISEMSFGICLYDLEDDKLISGAFHANRYWEENYVSTVIHFFRRSSQISADSIGFIDIGANIGSYSLPVAHLGYPVLAIEPNRASLALLAVSVINGNLPENLKLLRAGVSNKRKVTAIKMNPDNPGTSILENCSHDTILDKSGFMCLDDLVNSVLLDDLADMVPNRRAIMKIDIECGELNALDPSTSSKFFRINHIPLIVVDWKCYKPGSKDLQPRNQDLADWLSFFHLMDYKPISAKTGKRMSMEEWKKYSEEVLLLIKNGLNEEELWPR